jgi:Protein of unknown function (DUF3667)
VKLTTRKIAYGTESQNCKNCGHPFKGRVCNMCGEKVFDGKQLSAKHFFHEVVDFFYHFENKVLKTIKLNFLKPGFVTKENLNGIRVPYAKPVQLYLVVAFIFYLVVSKVGVTDYIPNYGDQNYFGLSGYKLFRWTEPADNWVVDGINSMWVKKGRQIEKKMQLYDSINFIQNNRFVLPGRGFIDSIVLPVNKLPVVSFRQTDQVRAALYNAKIGTYGKTLIFVLVPIIAGLFFLLFFRKIKYYGAALIFATHFMVYNLCVYSINAIINIGPRYINPHIKNLLMVPFKFIFYNKTISPFTEAVIGEPFEFFHLLFWMPWLYIAFKHLFNTVWWKNLLLSYLCSKIFYFFIFSLFKKLLIAFTVWTMHV